MIGKRAEDGAGFGDVLEDNTVFDAINRVTSITYSSANTPAASLTYDTCANGVGQLCVVSNGLSSETRSYDVLGRVANSAQQMPLASGGTTLASFPFQYEYDLGGGLKRMVYPSGREVLRESDKLGRAARLRGKASAGGSVFDYVSSLRYAAHGGVELSALGNGKKQQACYNNRLQVKAMRVGDADTAQCAADGADWLRLGFDYGTTNNNGNVRSQTIEARKDAGGFTSILQSYAHDGVNRLTQMTETGGAASWILNVGYDRYGNQWQGSPTESLSTLAPRNRFQVDAATNRLVKYWNDGAVPAGAYDGDGNLVNYTGIGASIFDGENRIVSVTGTSGTTAFEYDGNGRRVRKTAAGTSTLFVYDASGNLAAEYNGQTAAAGRFYVSGDHLGSTRLTMDASGGRVSCADYLPFGEEIQTGTAAAMRSGVGCFNGGAPLRQKFTGKERDAETGLDYFGARYMSAGLSRFSSPDPNSAGASLFDPQSWNGYSYVNNRPLSHIDPDGEVAIPLITGGVGGLIGGFVGGGVESLKQLRKTGSIENWGKVWTAAGGGAIAGAIAGATLGVGTGAGIAVTTTQAVIVNSSASVIGGIAQRSADEALGYEPASDTATEMGNVSLDALTGGIFGLVGGATGDKLFPIPNIQREVNVLRFAHRRTTRASRIQAARRNGERQARFNSIVGGVAGGIPTEGSKWVWQFFWSWFASEKKNEPNTRICYENGTCTVQ